MNMEKNFCYNLILAPENVWGFKGLSIVHYNLLLTYKSY